MLLASLCFACLLAMLMDRYWDFVSICHAIRDVVYPHAQRRFACTSLESVSINCLHFKCNVPMLGLACGFCALPSRREAHVDIQVLTGLAAASSNGSSSSQLRSSVSSQTVMGLFRDLQGIAQATGTRRTYGRVQLLTHSVNAVRPSGCHEHVMKMLTVWAGPCKWWAW